MENGSSLPTFNGGKSINLHKTLNHVESTLRQ